MDITHGSSVDDERAFDPTRIHEYLGPTWVVAVNGTDYNIVSLNQWTVTLVPSDFDTGDPIPGAKTVTLAWEDVQKLHIY